MTITDAATTLMIARKSVHVARNLAGLIFSAMFLSGYYSISYHMLCGNQLNIIVEQDLAIQPMNPTGGESSQPSDSLLNATTTTDHRIPEETAGDGQTTVIVTSNLIPSHPSIWMINETISSVSKHLIGLGSNYRLLLPVDGYKRGVKKPDRKRFYKYLETLEQAYPDATLFINWRSVGLTKNVLTAIHNVTTEFVYLVQHDMPFIADINHVGLVAAARATQGYPFNVRFNKVRNIPVGINRGQCWNANTILSHHASSGLYFTKTPSWSDNNQFATAAYYRHMFAQWISPNHERFPMEYRMQLVASRTEANCLGYGQYLYGGKKAGPHIGHLDGRKTPGN